MLILQIESGLYERQGRAVTNFKRTLPTPQSDLAQETIKDPYTFDFLTLADGAHERQLEQGLLSHIQKFLLELGVGFAFVGRQVHLEVEKEDFYIDLLFYHLRLRCFVVIELKNTKFKPEYAGKMNFYLSAVDDRLRHKDDQPSIGWQKIVFTNEGLPKKVSFWPPLTAPICTKDIKHSLIGVFDFKRTYRWIKSCRPLSR